MLIDGKTIETLYSDMKIQCHTCGLRFTTTDKLNKHLDHHFYLTQRLSKAKTEAISREWIPTHDEWISDNIVKTSSKLSDDDEQIEDEAIRYTLPVDNTQTLCPLCMEEFSQSWDDEQGIWIYEDCIRITKEQANEDSKKYIGTILHAICFNQLDEEVSNTNTTKE